MRSFLSKPEHAIGRGRGSGALNATFWLARLMLWGKVGSCQVQSRPYYPALGRNRVAIFSIPRCHSGE